MDWRPISADSHITEPPNCYVDNIDPAWREKAPHVVHKEGMGDIYVVEGMKMPVPMGLIAAAGVPPQDIRIGGAKFEDLHRSGWDPTSRLADQDKDGVAAEIIYPTVGMLICNHPDFDYKKACFDAYNRWLQAYCAHAPDRLIGLGQTAIRTIKEGIEDLERIKAMGFRGVMMPGNPGEKDYDDPAYDPFWEAAIALELPLSWHILTTSGDNSLTKPRGPKINGFLSIIRGCQDIMGMLVFSGVFERHPALRVVCVEADAGWAPHFMYRMDHAYKRHRYWMKAPPLARMPSDYFKEHIYITFQDDWVAFSTTELMNERRLDVGQRFPSLGLHLAQLPSGSPRTHPRSVHGHPRPHMPRQRRRTLRSFDRLAAGGICAGALRPFCRPASAAPTRMRRPVTRGRQAAIRPRSRTDWARPPPSGIRCRGRRAKCAISADPFGSVAGRGSARPGVGARAWLRGAPRGRQCRYGRRRQRPHAAPACG